MAVLVKDLMKSFSEPDERIDLPSSKIENLSLGENQISKVTMYPGWRWTKDVGPAAGTPLCEVPHVIYQVAGRMHIILRDGAEFDIEPDTFVSIPAGHDGYVIGDEPSEAVTFTNLVWELKK